MNEQAGSGHQGLFGDLMIVELGRGIASAFCTKMFADLGAEVIKIEAPGGNVLRRRRPFAGDVPGIERSGLFAYLNANKLGVTLDVTTRTGAGVLLRLVREADIVVEDNPPGWLGDAGLAPSASLRASYERLRAVNDGLIMTSITPFGQDGPWRDCAGNDFVAQHASGIAFSNGARVADLEREPPFVLPGSLGEVQGGLAAAAATMCALFARDQGGPGAHVDVAIEEVLAMHLQVDIAHVAYTGAVPGRSVAAQPPIPYIGQQPAADGYIDFVVRTEAEWRDFLTLFGNPAWGENELFATMSSRSQYWDALEPLVQEETQRYPKEQLFRQSQAQGVSAAAVYTVADAARAEHFAERGSFVEFEQTGIGTMRCPGAPIGFGSDGWRVRRPAPRLGEHNREVYVDRLGYTPRELVALRQAGIV